MYANLAYLGKIGEDIVREGEPLLVTAVGYYRIRHLETVETLRPEGRGDWQLLYIAKGRGQFFLEEGERWIGKGNVILFRPGRRQVYYYYAADKPEVYWVHFTGNQVAALLGKFGFPQEEFIFNIETSPNWQWLYRKMIRELQMHREGYPQILGVTLCQLLLEISRYRSEAKQVGAGMTEMVEEATQYFNDNYNKPISVEEYAQNHQMTPCWFIQNFKKITKLTPMQYIIDLRITNAMSLLQRREYNVAEVALAVGYENPLYFSRLFKKHTGISPSEYRGEAMKNE